MTFIYQKRSIAAGMTPIPLQGQASPAGDLILQSRGHSPMFRPRNMEYLDLTSDPYGPMSGPLPLPPPPALPLPSQLRSRSQNLASSHSLCGDKDDCGPLASHPFCATHCTSKHITYQSNNSCFGSLQC